MHKVALKFRLIAFRGVMDQQPPAQTYRAIEDASCMRTTNRYDGLGPLPCPFGS